MPRKEEEAKERKNEGGKEKEKEMLLHYESERNECP